MQVYCGAIDVQIAKNPSDPLFVALRSMLLAIAQFVNLAKTSLISQFNLFMSKSNVVFDSHFCSDKALYWSSKSVSINYLPCA